MPLLRSSLFCLSLITILALRATSFAQVGANIDPGAYVDFSLKTLLKVKTSDRRGARDLITQQIAAMAPDQQLAVTGNLVSRLNTADINTKVEIANVLALYPNSWATNNTDADCHSVYVKYQSEIDTTLKLALDAALANGKGLYRDGIRDYLTPQTDSMKSAEGKFHYMVMSYPDSQFSENASFYIGLAIINQYILGDRSQIELISASNTALEDYMKRVSDGEFGKKKDFYSGGYFYRGLNGWIQNNLADARKWMSDGSMKFTDDSNVYVYQLILSPGNKATVIDRFLPAHAVFVAAVQFLNTSPMPAYPNVDQLTKALTLL
jgi:TolA-binding protein